jgi:Domain of unknown function (DUF4331)
MTQLNLRQTLSVQLAAVLVLSLAGCPADDTKTDTSTTTTTTTTMTEGFAFATDDPSAYARVDRMGMPAVATAVVSSKDDYNAADPTDDASLAFAGEIIGNVIGIHAALDDDLSGAGLTPCGASGTEPTVGMCIDQAAPFVLPDTIALDTSVTSGFPNGRQLADPVIDVTLALVLLDLSVHDVTTLAGLPLNPNANDLAFSSSFPYLAAAH